MIVMSNGAYGANIFANQAGYVAGFIDGNGIKRADEASFLGADRHAGTAVDAGVPANLEDHRVAFSHAYIFLYSESGLK